MNERIKELRKALGLTQQDFADRIGSVQNTITGYETGRRAPSNQVVALICREFNVNENWLRTGEGQMFIQVSRDEEIAAFIGDVLSGETGDFRRRLISVLARLDTDQWELLEHIAEELAQIEKEGAEQ
ncbi:helix-turn-helix domain-containing protein [Intestinimonas butyriciproducens]|uniref:Helix-turn-helix protein n=1 Tax=Intestinimonas butyriciproducens TaxID=1297617 RepID=A0A2U1BEG8_9FIRM|nr:helix-turn-helix transcriptional regulator [Intestinimonas butyriciproducens]MCR1905148.1 helix-turn-helix transcriptional regulator [Intestinimonas butyriciproducens]PVY47026.1 helix-turn-helix protein [Intestinimonas butyriciproducens]QBB65774.1 Transcriptional regulator, Cro/CI family [Intestinimonas butyriciproducens]